jgi:hypothetical protein
MYSEAGGGLRPFDLGSGWRAVWVAADGAMRRRATVGGMRVGQCGVDYIYERGHTEQTPHLLRMAAWGWYLHIGDGTVNRGFGHNIDKPLTLGNGVSKAYMCLLSPAGSIITKPLTYWGGTWSTVVWATI